MRLPDLVAIAALSVLLGGTSVQAQTIPLAPPPPPTAEPANTSIQRAFSSISQAQTTNPGAAAAARFQYQEALARYRNGDLVGATNAATRAQAIVGVPPLPPPTLPVYPAIPSYTGVQQQTAAPGTIPAYAPPPIPAQPLLAEDPLDALLALVQRDIQVAKRTPTYAPRRRRIRARSHAAVPATRRVRRARPIVH